MHIVSVAISFFICSNSSFSLAFSSTRFFIVNYMKSILDLFFDIFLIFLCIFCVKGKFPLEKAET